MPERHVRIGRGVQTLWVLDIADIEQQAVTTARTAGEADGRVDRDVMALYGP